MAIANTTGTREFYVNYPRESSSLLLCAKFARRYYPIDVKRKSKIEVSVTTIDDFCSDNAIYKIDILKMDIQGAELITLQGATEKLKQGLIAIIYTEVMFVPHYEGGPVFYEVCNFLSNYGYTLFDIYNNFHARNGQLSYGDAIFVSPRIRKEVMESFYSTS